MASEKPRVIVSVTSHRPRFATLSPALESLLSQTVLPNCTVLFVGEGERDHLPEPVQALADRGLEIRETADLGPFTKLIPALSLYATDVIVTADDDVVYPENWLEQLVDGHRRWPAAIICHRGHRITYSAEGQLAPYEEWELDVQDGTSRVPASDLLATGVGGVLYPPTALHPAVTDSTEFLRLCPTGDDLWFHWMARLVRTKTVKVGERFRCNYVAGSQQVALWPANRSHRNDDMITALISSFGNPQ